MESNADILSSLLKSQKYQTEQVRVGIFAVLLTEAGRKESCINKR